MKKITRLILGSSLLMASTFSFSSNNFAGDNNRSGGGSYNNNDWSDTPWGRNNSSRNSNNSMPWGGDMMPWGTDNPFWDSGSSAWRDWDTNKWGGNGMPWGGGSGIMPWSKDKDRKYNKKRDYRGYARPYGGGYGYPYPYQGNAYRGNPYNPAQGYAPPPAPAPVR